MNDNDNASPMSGDSLSEYAPNKFQHLLAASAFGLNMSSKETSTTKSDSRAKSPMEKPKTPSTSSSSTTTTSRRRSFIRCFLPNNRSRLASLPTSNDESTKKSTDDTCDMRLFIIRHGERVDRYFGPSWYRLVFDQNNQYRPYHRNFPPSLPARSNNSLWALDTPLTLAGLKTAEHLGRTLRSKNFLPTYVYSSPAMRCIQTTIHILKGLDLHESIAIRIEPGLLELGAARFGMNVFYQPHDWSRYGVNVDLSYQPIVAHIPAFEREDTYYLRSKHVIREMEKNHQKNFDQSPNIFIIGHATSPDTLTWDLVGRQPNANDLYRFALKIAYLQTTIAERRQENRCWSINILR